MLLSGEAFWHVLSYCRIGMACYAEQRSLCCPTTSISPACLAILQHRAAAGRCSGARIPRV